MILQLDGAAVRKVFDQDGNQVKSGADLDPDRVYICTDGRIPYCGTPRRTSVASPTRRASTNVTHDGRPRHVDFTRDPNRPTVKVLIRPRHVASFEALLDELSERVDGYPVRHIRDTHGKDIRSAGDLRSGEVYVCFEGIAPLGAEPNKVTGRRSTVGRIMATELVPNKVITVFGNGMTDSAGHRVVLNKRTAPSYDRLLDLVGKLIPLQGGVRKLYTLPECKLVRGLPLPGDTTDFIAVGTIGLNRKRLPRLAPAQAPVLPDSAKSSETDREIRAKRAAKPRGKVGKRLPPIDGNDHDRGSISLVSPLPPVSRGDEASVGTRHSGEDRAHAVMAAAEHAEAAKFSERERQRQKHQERYLNRQKARQQNRDNKVEQVAMAAERVDGRIDEERARQERALKARIDKRTAPRSQPKPAPGNESGNGLSEDEAAVKIQSAWRGHRQRSDPATKRAKNKRSCVGNAKGGASNRPPSPKSLLKMKRIPTPDLDFSKEDEEKVRELAATRIQKTFRGHQTRKNLPENVRPKASRASVAGGQKGPEPETREERRARRKKEKEAKRTRKPDRATKTAANTETAGGGGGGGGDNGTVQPKPPVYEREGSRFSTRGIEDKSVVETQYEIGKKIGDGNFAVVRECIRRADGIKLALKIIDKSKTVGAKESKMIENEVKSMRSINHPNCVRLYDVIDTKEEIFLVMELVPGGDLFDRIVDHGKYSEVDAATIIKNMTTALDHMHSQSIIHRDLKPENLLVSTDDNGRDTVKLADFGLSMRVKEPLHTICGTPTYVAPEIISEIPSGYSFPVDMWATGIISYIILCGFPPFASATKSQKDLFRKIRSGKFSFPDPYWRNVSDGAKDLIRKLLVVDPDARYTAKQVLEHPWIQQHTDSIEL